MLANGQTFTQLNEKAAYNAKRQAAEIYSQQSACNNIPECPPPPLGLVATATNGFVAARERVQTLANRVESVCDRIFGGELSEPKGCGSAGVAPPGQAANLALAAEGLEDQIYRLSRIVDRLEQI